MRVQHRAHEVAAGHSVALEHLELFVDGEGSFAIATEPGEHWPWCYVDEQMVEYRPAK